MGAGLVIYMILSESLSQPGIKELDGKYEELSFYRNENNTGPVLRIYAIRALDSDSTWMEKFALAQPHTKYGRTLVFFFSEQVKDSVILSSQEPYFPQELKPYLLAEFEKSPMGEERFIFLSK